MRHYDWTYEKRYLWRFFEVNGYERSQPRWDGDHFFGGSLSNHTFPTTQARLEAWLHDSLLWTIENLEVAEGGGGGGSGELIYAFRGFIQATGHRAQIPGEGGNNVADLWLNLKNYFEEKFQDLSRERDVALMVMEDAMLESGQLSPFHRRQR